MAYSRYSRTSRSAPRSYAGRRAAPRRSTTRRSSPRRSAGGQTVRLVIEHTGMSGVQRQISPMAVAGAIPKKSRF